MDNAIFIGLWPTEAIGPDDPDLKEKQLTALRKAQAGDLSGFEVQFSDSSTKVMQYVVVDEEVRQAAFAALMKHHGTGCGSFEGVFLNTVHGEIEFEIDFDKPVMEN